MARENKFKKALDKDKTKEIVGNTTVEENIITDETTTTEASTKKKTKKDDNAPVVDTVETESTTTEEDKEVTDNPTDNNPTGDNPTGDNPTRDNPKKKKTTPTKKLKEDTTKKPEIVKIGVSIKETIKDKVEILAEDNSMKANEVVVELLSRIFDGKEFSVDFGKKENSKVTSFNIPSNMDKAITKLNKKTGIPKSEIFNKLLDEAMKEFYNN